MAATSDSAAAGGPSVDLLTPPAEDGGILVHPPAAEFVRLIDHNRRLRRTRQIALGGKPAPEITDGGGGPPVIGNGHQPNFHHPGVWAKQVVAARAAAELGGSARLWVVDSDAPRPPALSWPRVRPAGLEVESLGWPPAAGTFEDLGGPRSAGWGEFAARLAGLVTQWPGTPLGAFVDALTSAAGLVSTPPHRPDAPADYVDCWIAAMRAVEPLLGVPPTRFERVSRLESGPLAACWERFAAHCLDEAERLAADYNAALADYRRRRRIRGTQHPIPDLQSDASRIEAPFWLIGADGLRRRLWVSRGRRGKKTVLFAYDQRVAELPPLDQVAAGAGFRAALGAWRLRPRALMLTTFARLFACDLFLHGVGGAKYDRIADGFIRAFFRVEPPAYACVTATLRLPLPRRPAGPGDLLAARRAERDLAFNPQRYLGPRTDEEAVRALLREREEAAAQSQRLRDVRRFDRAARREAFERIRRANTSLADAARRASDPAARLAALRRELSENRLADSREWFFGLHSVERLRALCDALPQRFGRRG